MLRPIAYYVKDYPEHGAIIGDMLLGFADLESLMSDIVGQALGGDEGINTAVRLLFRLKGAEDRLNAADAVLRPFMASLALHGPYSQWLGAMRHCKKIRNQYAHCAWDSINGELHFASLMDAAQAAEGEAILPFKPIELELLERQHAYFHYASDLTLHLMSECRYLQDRRRRRLDPLPKSRAKPNLHSPLH